MFKAISALQVAHSKSELDLYNLESVFGAFEMARLFGRRIGEFPLEEIENLPSAIRILIVEVLETTQEFQYEGTFSDTRHYRAPLPYGDFVKQFIEGRNQMRLRF